VPLVPPDGDTRVGKERTLSQLVAQASEDISTIISKEIELAKLEIQGSLVHVKQGVPLLVVAGVLVLYAIGLLFTAGAWGLYAAGLPAWAAFLIVGGVLVVLAGILAHVGQKALKKVNPKPTRVIAGVEETLSTLKSARESGSVHAKAVPASKSQVALPRAASGSQVAGASRSQDS
jgi:glucose dehydrogenase